MDWRLIAAVASAAASCGLVAVVATAFVNTAPDQPKKVSRQPILLAERGASPAFAAPAARPTTIRLEAPDVLVLDRPAEPYKLAALNSTAPVTDLVQRQVAKPMTVPVAEPKKTPQVAIAPAPPKPQLTNPLSQPRPDQRSDGVLTPSEIARIKSALRLTPEQAIHWPPVQSALNEMGKQQAERIRRGQKPEISGEDWPPQRLYWIAGPFLGSLRPDQKEQVRALCRSLGFQTVASML